MNDNSISHMTAFDSFLQTQQLQMIKAAIPYIQTSEQKLISIYVKILELTQTINLFEKKEDVLKMCSMDEGCDSSSEIPIRMLTDIRCFCAESEKETIDMLLNFLSAFELFKSYSDSQEGESTNNANPFSLVKNFLSPEQSELFETYQNQFT